MNLPTPTARRLALVLPLAAAISACSSGTAANPGTADAAAGECVARADCAAKGDAYRGFVCTANGACDHCSSDGQCELRELCSPEKRICLFKPGWGADCARNAQCPAGQLCVQGLCKPEKDAVLCVGGACLADGLRCNRSNGVCEEDIGCLADAECADTELCNLPTHTCVLRCTAETQGSACAPGQKCVDGRCSDCAGASDCPGGLTCDLGKLQCVADGSARCLSNRDCEVGLTCNRATGFCTDKPPPCLSNEDCLPDERCDVASGKCVLRACQPDRYEPNGDASGAKAIAAGSYASLTLCEREQDWYSLRLARGDRIDVFVDADALLEDVMDTRLLDGTGRVLAQGRLALDRVVAADATYFLRLQSTDAHVSYGLRLSLSKGTPCDDDRFEPNDEARSATSLHDQGDYDKLTVCGPDVDWFALEVPAASGARVELHHVPTEGDLDLHVYAADGQTLLGSSATTEPLEAVAIDAAAAAGKVMIKVASADARAAGEYFLRIGWQP